MTNTAKSENVRSGELTGLTPRNNAQRLALWLWKRGAISHYRLWPPRREQK